MGARGRMGAGASRGAGQTLMGVTANAGGRASPTAQTLSPIRISSAKDARHRYLEIADTHVRAFYGSTIKRSEFWSTLLRLDRVMTLDDGRGRDNVDCLVGCVEGFSTGDVDLGENWILSLLERALEGGREEEGGGRRVVGAVTIDGNWGLGAGGRSRRDKHAYIANLAVHPAFRRRYAFPGERMGWTG